MPPSAALSTMTNAFTCEIRQAMDISLGQGMMGFEPRTSEPKARTVHVGRRAIFKYRFQFFYQIIEKNTGHSRSRVFREVETLYQCQGNK